MEVTSLDQARKILLSNNESYLANALLARKLQTNSKDYDSLFQLGLGYLKSSDFPSAIICFATLKQATNSFESFHYLARAYDGNQDSHSAKEIYLDALLIPTTNIDLLFETYKNLGNLYLKERHFDLAEDFYHKAYGLSPESCQLLVNLGTLEVQKGDLSLALERFRKALKIDQEFSPAWTGLAISYQQLGDFDLAWASLLRAIDSSNKNTTALLLLAQWAAKHNAVKYALDRLMNFFDEGAIDTVLSLAFVELCIQSGNFFLARVEIERVLLWHPQNMDLQKFDRALVHHGY